MSTVYKYPIVIDDRQIIHLPDGAKIVHVGLDPNNSPAIWAVVDPENTPQPVVIWVRGTGHQVPEPSTHLGSFNQGPFVWHVFTP